MTDADPQLDGPEQDDEAPRRPMKMWKLMVWFLVGALVLGSSILWLGYFVN